MINLQKFLTNYRDLGKTKEKTYYSYSFVLKDQNPSKVYYVYYTSRISKVQQTNHGWSCMVLYRLSVGSCDSVRWRSKHRVVSSRLHDYTKFGLFNTIWLMNPCINDLYFNIIIIIICTLLGTLDLSVSTKVQIRKTD